MARSPDGGVLGLRGLLATETFERLGYCGTQLLMLLYIADLFGRGFPATNSLYGNAAAVFGPLEPAAIFSRTANASFDSKEFRISGRVGYDFALGGVVVTPFAKIEARRYDFEAFDEANAGGIGLAVAQRDRTVVSPEAGLRLGGGFGIVRPFAEASYVFQGNVRADRDVAYQGDRTTSFRLRGVDPDGYAKLGAGLSADVYGANVSLRGNYLTGGGNSAGEVLGGIAFRF